MNSTDIRVECSPTHRQLDTGTAKPFYIRVGDDVLRDRRGIGRRFASYKAAERVAKKVRIDLAADE